MGKHKYGIAVLVIAAAFLVWALINPAFFYERSLSQSSSAAGSPWHDYLLIFIALSLIIVGFIAGKIIVNNSAMLEMRRKHSVAMEASMDGIAIYNREGQYIYVNQAYAMVNGFESAGEIIGKTYRMAYDEKEIERIEQTLLPILMKSGKWRGELMARRKNGGTYFQEASVTMLDDGGRICIVRDITWRKRNEERLQRSEWFLNTIFNSIRDPFCIFDNEYRIIRTNDAYAQLKNKPANEMIGRKCYELLEGKDSVCEGCVVHKTFHSADPCAKDKVVVQGGNKIWVEIYTYPILDEKSNVSHVIEYTRDITDRKKSEAEKGKLIEKLEYLSRTDSLTGLINRRALTDSLTYEIDRAKRGNSELSLIICDIDNFKDINDRYGHDAGDRVLQTMSATLKIMLRKVDIAGRYGGDEFMLILPETSLNGAKSLAEKFLSEIRSTDLQFQDGKSIYLSMSIGVACMGPDGEGIDSLVKRADDAMYAAKQNGRNQVSVLDA